MPVYQRPSLSNFINHHQKLVHILFSTTKKKHLAKWRFLASDRSVGVCFFWSVKCCRCQWKPCSLADCWWFFVPFNKTRKNHSWVHTDLLFSICTWKYIWKESCVWNMYENSKGVLFQYGSIQIESMKKHLYRSQHHFSIRLFVGTSQCQRLPTIFSASQRSSKDDRHSNCLFWGWYQTLLDSNINRFSKKVSSECRDIKLVHFLKWMWVLSLGGNTHHHEDLDKSAQPQTLTPKQIICHFHQIHSTLSQTSMALKKTSGASLRDSCHFNPSIYIVIGKRETVG